MMRHAKCFAFMLVCSTVGFIGACGDDDDDHPVVSSAGAAGATASGTAGSAGSHAGGTQATGGHTNGEAGSTTEAGFTGEGGAAGARPATAGEAGQGQGGGTGHPPQGGGAGQEMTPAAGQGGQGGARMTLEQACAIQCEAQKDLTVSTAGAGGAGDSCYDAELCEFFCTEPITGTDWPTSCPDEYVAMVECEAQLKPDEWYCSDLGDEVYVPGPTAGTACEQEICAWTCCDQSVFTLPDVVERCNCSD
jgi:hypothetical protein